MAHRAKHLRRNWIPERRKRAYERAETEYQRQYAAELKRELESGDTELEPGS